MKNIIIIMLSVLLNIYAAGTWQGDVSTNWDTAGNWDDNIVPTTNSNLTIPAVVAPNVYPTLSANALCKGIKINAGATLNGGSGQLTIKGGGTNGFNNLGTFNPGTSTILMTPSSGFAAGRIYIVGVRTFYNLTISGTADAGLARVNDVGAVTVQNDFKFEGGTIQMNNNNLTVGGNYSHYNATYNVKYQQFNDITMTGSQVYLSPPQDISTTNFIDGNFKINTPDSVRLLEMELKVKNMTITSGKFTSFDSDYEQWMLVNFGKSDIAGYLTVNTGCTARLGNSAITVYSGNVTVNGTLNLSDDGNGTLNISGGSLAGTNSGAVINADAEAITIGKNFNFAGTFNKGTSTVEFVSSSETQIADNTQFYNLNFNKTNSSDVIRPVNLGSIVSFTNDLTWNGGYWYQGGLRAVKTGITSFDIPNYCAVTLASSGDVTVTKFTQTTPPGGPNAIKNYLVISNPSQNVSSIKDYYVAGGGNDELKTGYSNTAGNLKTWRSINAGTSWTKVGGTDAAGAVTFSASPAASSGSTTYFAFMDNSSTSLPVEFDSTFFYARSTDTGISLQWLTHSEENLKGFVVYRSTEPNSNFVEIDSWLSNEILRSKNDGYSTSDTEYSYLDTGVEEGITYYYRIKAYCSENDQGFHPKTVSATFEGAEISGLAQNYPNPFNSQTTIKFIVGKELPVSLIVYNSNGQIVKELVSGIHKKGIYTISMNSSEIASGMYYYRLKVGDKTFIKKMMSIK